MDKQEINEKSKPIELVSNSGKAILLIHGYSGSPTDFNDLPKVLNNKLGADVYVPCLYGHGSRVENLNDYDFEDYLRQVEYELVKLIDNDIKVIVGGHSFGAQLALCLASRHSISGVFTTAIPYVMRFPFNLPLMEKLARTKKYWKKKLSQEEIAERKDAFYYDSMPGKGYFLVNKANEDINSRINYIECPCLTIHSTADRLSHESSAKKIESLINSKIKHSKIFDNSRHSIFYCSLKDDVSGEICNFIINNKLLE